MRALLNDLRLRDRRDVLKDILENAVPDHAAGRGHHFRHGQRTQRTASLVQETYANKIYSRDVDGKTLSAIQITTAAAICAVLDLLATGKIPQRGFIRQEDMPLQAFLENRFGQVYASPSQTLPHAQFGGAER